MRDSRGRPALILGSLGSRGPLRWFAGCCRTPIANSPASVKLPFAGVVHSCIAEPPPGGAGKRTPFRDPETGELRAVPEALDAEERRRLATG